MFTVERRLFLIPVNQIERVVPSFKLTTTTKKNQRKKSNRETKREERQRLQKKKVGSK